MITQGRARRIAEDQLFSQFQCPVAITQVIDREDHWEFHWDSGDLEPKGAHWIRMENPFAVYKEDGTVMPAIRPSFWDLDIPALEHVLEQNRTDLVQATKSLANPPPDMGPLSRGHVEAMKDAAERSIRLIEERIRVLKSEGADPSG